MENSWSDSPSSGPYLDRGRYEPPPTTTTVGVPSHDDHA
jgi:hypothetical protein